MEPEKKISGSGGARRVPKGRLAGTPRPGARQRPLRVRGRVFDKHLALPAIRLVAQGRASARPGGDAGAGQLGGQRLTLLASMGLSGGMGLCVAVEGATTGAVFEAYLGDVLTPSLRPGQVVVMDNLSSHKGSRIRELIEERGCELVLPAPLLAGPQPHRASLLQAQGLAAKGEG